MSNVIPYVIESTSKGERSYDIFSRMLKERVMFLTGTINDSLSDRIIASMLFLESDSPDKPINLYINSPGGGVTPGLAIYGVMQYIKSPVHTYVVGQAASMGSFLAQAGAAGYRYVLTESRTMIHRVSHGLPGTSGNIHHTKDDLEEMKRSHEEAERINSRLTSLYVKHNTAGKTFEEFTEIMRYDTYLDCNEAISMGVADTIIEKR